MPAQVGGGHFFAEEAKEAEDQMPGHDDAPADASKPREASVGVSVSYTISADGCVSMQWSIDASKALPGRLPSNLFK